MRCCARRRATNGTFSTPAPAGEYTVTTESQAGLTVSRRRCAWSSSKAGRRARTSSWRPCRPAVMDSFPAPGAPPPGTAPAATEPPAPAAAGGAGRDVVFAETTGAGAQIQFKPVTCFVAGRVPPARRRHRAPGVRGSRPRLLQGEPGRLLLLHRDERGRAAATSASCRGPTSRRARSRTTSQATSTEFEESQTREIEAAVVENKDDCGDREMAAIGPPGPVTVFSAASGASARPVGFAARPLPASWSGSSRDRRQRRGGRGRGRGRRRPRIRVRRRRPRSRARHRSPPEQPPPPRARRRRRSRPSGRPPRGRAYRQVIVFWRLSPLPAVTATAVVQEVVPSRQVPVASATSARC